MKNKILVCAVAFVLFMQSVAACKTSAGSSQINAADDFASNVQRAAANNSTVNKEFNQNVNQPPTAEKNAAKPETKTIKLTEKLKKKNLTKADYLKLSETLGWKGFCEAGNAIDENAETLNIPFHKLGDNE